MSVLFLLIRSCYLFYWNFFVCYFKSTVLFSLWDNFISYRFGFYLLCFVFVFEVFFTLWFGIVKDNMTGWVFSELLLSFCYSFFLQKFVVLLFLINGSLSFCSCFLLWWVEMMLGIKFLTSLIWLCSWLGPSNMYTHMYGVDRTWVSVL